MIKRTQIPIMCICNEKGHTKIRSLSNYCFDLRFQRPRVEQIKVSSMDFLDSVLITLLFCCIGPVLDVVCHVAVLVK